MHHLVCKRNTNSHIKNIYILYSHTLNDKLSTACGSLYNMSMQINNIPAEKHDTMIRGTLKEPPWHSMFETLMQNTIEATARQTYYNLTLKYNIPTRNLYTYIIILLVITMCIKILEIKHLY